MGEWLRIGMKQIAVRVGFPLVFSLERIEGGLWLLGYLSGPGSLWNPENGFVFRLRLSSRAKLATGQAS